MAGTEYPKLWAPYKREVKGPNKNKLIIGQWSRPEFDILSNQDWWWTEKVNGRNVRITWDGHRVSFGSRNDEGALPDQLLENLGAAFPEELFENQFHGQPAVLYGEGYGAHMADGSGVYRRDPGFIMFDALVADAATKELKWWLLPSALQKLADDMGIGVVPCVLEGSISEAVAMVTSPHFVSLWGDFVPEGLVGKPPAGLCGRDGDRLMLKIKPKDFVEGEK